MLQNYEESTRKSGLRAGLWYGRKQVQTSVMHEGWLAIKRINWCNGYCRRKWTRRLEFKSWTRLIAFHIALIPLGKVWIQLFSLKLGSSALVRQQVQEKENSELNPVKLRLKIDLVSYPARAEGLVNRIKRIN